MKNKKYKFQEEEQEKPAEVAESAEGTTEESETQDSHEQFVNILVEMGLSAEQAEAVHQMAMDLVNAGGAQEGEPTKEEMRRAPRGRRQMSRGYGRPRRPKRDFEAQGTPPRGRRPERFAEANRTEVMLRRQERRIRQLESQLREMGQQPATRPLSQAPQKFSGNVKPEIPTEGNIQDRVFKTLGVK